MLNKDLAQTPESQNSRGGEYSYLLPARLSKFRGPGLAWRGKGKGKNKATTKKKAKPRAVSAYLVFSREARPEAAAAVGTRAVGPVAQELSRRWRCLDDEARAEYEAEAAEANRD